MNGEQVRARRIAASYYQICAHVSLVPEEVLLQHGHDGNDAGFAAGGKRVKLQVGGHESGGEFCVCGRSGARAPDVRRDVVKFLAVLCGVVSIACGGGGLSKSSVFAYLVRYYGPARRPGVGGNHHAPVE